MVDLICCNSEVISVMLEKVIVGLCCSRTINGFESQSDHPSVWDRVDIAYVFFFCFSMGDCRSSSAAVLARHGIQIPPPLLDLFGSHPFQFSCDIYGI